MAREKEMCCMEMRILCQGDFLCKREREKFYQIGYFIN